MGEQTRHHAGDVAHMSDLLVLIIMLALIIIVSWFDDIHHF